MTFLFLDVNIKLPKAAKARLLNELVGLDGGCLRDREVPFLLPQNWRLDWFKGTS
jgi:hypothetical protein